MHARDLLVETPKCVVLGAVPAVYQCRRALAATGAGTSTIEMDSLTLQPGPPAGNRHLRTASACGKGWFWEGSMLYSCTCLRALNFVHLSSCNVNSLNQVSSRARGAWICDAAARLFGRTLCARCFLHRSVIQQQTLGLHVHSNGIMSPPSQNPNQTP